MVKLSVLYGPPTDPAAFEQYYAGKHMGIAQQMKGVNRIEYSKVLATPDGSRPSYYRTAELYFDDLDQLKRVLSSPEGKATAADLSNFATGGVTMLISEVG